MGARGEAEDVEMTTVPGEALEIEVERIYRVLGATGTKRRVLFKNYEIDVFAEFRKGPFEFAIVVECKEYESKRVPDSDMRGFVVKLLAAREAGIADKGVFVTTSEFAKTALATAAAHNIQCLTLDQLYNQLVSFDEYLEATAKEFAGSDLGAWYVEQTASDIEDYESLSTSARDEYLHNPLTEYVDHMFSRESEHRVAILGNFGTGKTSFCYKYRDVLLKRHLEDSKQRIPVLVSLRDFRSGMDIHGLITATMERLPGVQLDSSLCLELQRMGRLFFLIDGLDEMATRVDRSVVNENLREIERLTSDGDNRFLITCRTHFFQERISDEFLKDYRVVYLTEWGTRELASYLKRRFGSDWKTYSTWISKSRQLTELSRTPLLLEMLLRALRKMSPTENMVLSALYEAYTEEWTVAESRRRGAVMSPKQRRQFVEVLATKLHTENRSGIHYSELYEIAREFSGYGDATKLDYFDNDARTCTYIVKDSKGNYNFRHRSFGEFFFSQAVLRTVNGSDESLIQGAPLTEDVLQFIEPGDIGETGKRSLQEWSERRADPTVSENSVRLLLRMGVDLPKHVQERHGIDREMSDAFRGAMTSDDEGLFETFVRDYYADLLTMARRMTTRSSYSAEELVNECLLRLWTRRDQMDLKFTSEVQFRRYLATMMRSILYDQLRVSYRREARFPALELVEEQLAISTSDDRFDAEELWRVVDEILDSRFSAPIRQAFFARFRDNKSVKEIAGELGVSATTVRQMMYRARKVLAEELRKRGFEP